MQEQNQKNDIAQKIIQAGYTRDQNMAQYLAQAILSKSNAQAQEHQYAASYNFNAWQAQQEADRYQAELSYNKAMNEVSTFGRIITQEAADALGLPIGTSSYAVQQAEGAKKKVSSGGGNNPADIALQIAKQVVKNNGFTSFNKITLDHAKAALNANKGPNYDENMAAVQYVLDNDLYEK